MTLRQFIIPIVALAWFAPSVATAQGSLPFPKPRQIEGLSIEERDPELDTDKPAFAGQTRAPFHKSNTAYNVTLITDKLKLPWSMQFLPDGRMLVTEKVGTMRLVDPDGRVSDPLSGVPAVSYSGDAGLLDVQLDPSFPQNHIIYFNYIRPEANDQTRMALAKATLNEAVGALDDVRVIFLANELRPKLPANNQNGRITFASDGTIFMSLGGRANLPRDSAQNLLSDLGKIIHITTDGVPIKSNPYFGQSNALPEIWSFGHRTPEGLAFDAQGRLWETEHGPRGGDELNLIQPGKNYGWPLVVHGINYNGEKFFGGLTGLPNVIEPRYYWDPVIAPASLTFYHGKMFPEWDGSALIGGLRSKILDRLTIRGDKVVAEEPLLVDLTARIRDARVAPDGAIYVLTDDTRILKITAQ
jgi:glucose/arabinose dehydrogenase